MNATKNLTTIPFNGGKKKWHVWKTRYKARSKLHGMLSILYGTETIPKDGKTSYKPDEEILRTKNDAMYADLVLCLQDEGSFACIERAKSKDHLDGLA